MFKLKPCYKDYLWGGTRLVSEYGKQPPKLPLAESWELSAHKNGQSIIAGGAYVGMEFGAYLDAHPEAIGVRCTETGFPMLVKFIDAEKPLSVQVHPNDAYAMSKENSKGKTELWYILEAQKDAFLYLGLNRPLTREAFLKHIENNTVEQVLRRVYVKPGETYLVEAGTLHAIGAGIVLAEIQQSSDVTYRVYDFGRTGEDGKPRALHIEQALDVADLTDKVVLPQRTVPVEHGVWAIARDRNFSVFGVSLHGQLHIPADGESFQALLCIDGELNAGELMLQKGETAFLPAGEGCLLKGEGMLLLLSDGRRKPRKRDAHESE